MLDIHLKTIPHREHRYPTMGDYWRDEDGRLQLRVSEMQNDDYAFLTAMHELIEWYLTEKRGIREEDIKAFDEQFEAEVRRGIHLPTKEPGDDPRAPYRQEHQFATRIEKELAAELGVDWERYGKEFSAFFLQFEGDPKTKAGSGEGISG